MVQPIRRDLELRMAPFAGGYSFGNGLRPRNSQTAANCPVLTNEQLLPLRPQLETRAKAEFLYAPPTVMLFHKLKIDDLRLFYPVYLACGVLGHAGGWHLLCQCRSHPRAQLIGVAAPALAAIIGPAAILGLFKENIEALRKSSKE